MFRAASQRFAAGRKNWKFARWLRRSQTFLANTEITNLYNQRMYLREKLQLYEQRFSRLVDCQVLFRLSYDEVRKKRTNEYRKVANRHQKKFDSLVNERSSPTTLPINDRWLVNLTDVDVPDEVCQILQLGPKFAIKNKKPPLARLITDTEYVIRETNAKPEKKDEVRLRIAGLLRGMCNGGNCQRSNPPSHSLLETKDFLEHHKNLLVLNADKTNTTVLMDRGEYKQKLLSILEDNTTYKKAQRDPTGSIQRKSNELVKIIHEKGYIDTAVKRWLTTYNSIAPKIYGLPKIHKPGIPLRPIVAYTGAPTYALSKFMAEILGNLRDESKNVRSSSDLKTKLADITLGPNDVVVSFDVVALFTSILVSLAVDIIKERWNELGNTFTALDVTLFFEILTFCLEKGYCQYEGTTYLQIDGVAMGSPLSPIIAEIVLDKVFDHIDSIVGTDIKFRTKYVDDSLFILHDHNFDKVFDALNNFHPRIKFTYEKECNNMINFLDVTIIRKHNKFIFRHYQKPTCTDRIINFHSTQPFSCKLNTAINLRNRPVSRSDPIFRKEMLQKVDEVLRMNGYPPHVICRVMKKGEERERREAQSRSKEERDTGRKRFFSIPYVGESSLAIRKMLKNLDPNINIAFGSHNTIRQRYFSKIKDLTPKEKNSGVVYEVPCSGCPKVYVGETSQLLKLRLSQHANDIQHQKRHTALADHSYETGHVFDFKDTKIVGYERNDKKRKLLEVVNIVKKKDAVNFKADSETLGTVYKYMIHKYM